MLVCMCYLTSCRVVVILTDTHFTAQNALLVVVQLLHASGDKHSVYTQHSNEASTQPYTRLFGFSLVSFSVQKAESCGTKTKTGEKIILDILGFYRLYFPKAHKIMMTSLQQHKVLSDLRKCKRLTG